MLDVFPQGITKLAVTSLVLSAIISVPTSAGTYVVGCQNFDYSPHYNFTSDYEKGFIWSVLELFAKKSGHKFIYETMPVPRLQIELKKGTVDLIYPDNPIFHPSGEPTPNKTYSLDIVRTLSGAIIKPENLWMKMDDVKTVSLPSGFTPLDWHGRETSGEISFIETKDSLTALQLVEKGRANVAEVDYFVSKHLSATNPTIGHFTLSLSLPTNIIGFRLATIDETSLVEELNHFIKTNDEEIERIKLRYGLLDPDTVLKTLQNNQLSP